MCSLEHPTPWLKTLKSIKTSHHTWEVLSIPYEALHELTCLTLGLLSPLSQTGLALLLPEHANCCLRIPSIFLSIPMLALFHLCSNVINSEIHSVITPCSICFLALCFICLLSVFCPRMQTPLVKAVGHGYLSTLRPTTVSSSDNYPLISDE
jgi:hypothetical protein